MMKTEAGISAEILEFHPNIVSNHSIKFLELWTLSMPSKMKSSPKPVMFSYFQAIQPQKPQILS